MIVGAVDVRELRENPKGSTTSSEDSGWIYFLDWMAIHEEYIYRPGSLAAHVGNNFTTSQGNRMKKQNVLRPHSFLRFLR